MRDIPAEFKEQFKEIQVLKRKGEFEKALEKSKILLTKYPNSGLAFLQNGGLYKDIGKLDESIDSFKKAVEIFPNTEKISLCLFHVLWRKGLRFEALEEMKRYLTNNKSDEYTEILDGITAKLHEKPNDSDLEQLNP